MPSLFGLFKVCFDVVDPFGMFDTLSMRSFVTDHLSGWKVVLTQRVPELASAAHIEEPSAADFDWALHPGGATIISGVRKVMNLTEENLRASYEIYITHGNSSSATIFSVIHRLLLDSDGKDHVVGCAFGPGIAIEMMLFKKSQTSRSGSGDTGVLGGL